MVNQLFERGNKKTRSIFSLDMALSENATEQAVIMKGWDIKVALQGYCGPSTWFQYRVPDCLLAIRPGKSYIRY
jgi:hypothetical protein